MLPLQRAGKRMAAARSQFHRRSVANAPICAGLLLLWAVAPAPQAPAGHCWSFPASRRSSFAVGLTALAGLAPPAKAERFELSYLKPGNPKEIEYRDPDVPPVPDENPFIRKMQAKSWAMEPIIRTRLYIMNEKRRVQPNPFADKKFLVKWANDSTRFDVLNEKAYNEASSLGKVLKDEELSYAREDFDCYMYASPQDQEWVNTKLNVYSTIALPEELLKTLEKLRSQKFLGE
mmetsp:Transcript_70015/g.161962  ORF Transcript_70015/g.161962 Transcript_70015/m.161962 type:complete len:233 (+) Transcript_70015:31-729(+)